MSKIIDGIAKDLKAIPETLKAKTGSVDKKKLILMNLPYILAGYFCDKIAWLWRVSPGSNASDKMMAAMNGLNDLFSNPLPSFFPKDLLIGIAGGVVLRLVVYFKAKNAKKFRQGVEYGSARWGNAKDIEPYVDPVFENNVILTETERLMMSGRPKQPKYARNKNILVIGGSGSGKTRFFVKPNLMQMHSSYVVTDPKGTVLVECGKMLLKNGYKVKVLNTINFKKSMHYNPFAYIRSEKDILKLVNTIILNKSLIAAARENNVEVIYVRHVDGTGAELTKGTPGFEMYEGFSPKPGEKIFDKTVNSSFKGTGLLEYLREKNVHTVVVVGLQTDYCIEATIKCGFEHGFKMIVPENANSTFDNAFMTGEQSYKYYNEFMWKGRYAECVSVEETIKRMKG